MLSERLLALKSKLEFVIIVLILFPHKRSTCMYTQRAYYKGCMGDDNTCIKHFFAQSTVLTIRFTEKFPEISSNYKRGKTKYIMKAVTHMLPSYASGIIDHSPSTNCPMIQVFFYFCRDFVRIIYSN